jgi:hypothetical protein
VKDLTKLARGEDCLIRVPHICCGNPERVVLCHVKLIGISGYGLKSPDALAAYGCGPCHDYVDGRVIPPEFPATHDERRLMLLEGMARTQYKLIQRGIVKW